jgi:Xaa-Pro aminopeptidase
MARSLKRLDALKERAFEKKGFDGFLIANEANLLYFAGFPGTSALLVSKKGENTIYVYNVNYEQAKAEGKEFKVQLVGRGENLMAKVARQVRTCHIRKLALDLLGFENYCTLVKAMREGTEVEAQSSLLWGLRKVKDENEIELMRKAAELTSEGIKVAYEVIRSGVKEYEVAAEIEYAMRKKGSYGTAFQTSVASGARSAFPHGGCSDREIRAGDLVVVDIGATYKFYCSDMTRTLVAGKPSEKQKKIHEIVKQAHERAFQAIEPNVQTRDVDAVARKVIEEAGYGEYFVHSLGHGIGLEVHEPPALGPESKDKLQVGNVVTNEPGIYIVGYGGVRIEDTVLVTKQGAEKLTDGPYSLGP